MHACTCLFAFTSVIVAWQVLKLRSYVCHICIYTHLSWTTTIIRIRSLLEAYCRLHLRTYIRTYIRIYIYIYLYIHTHAYTHTSFRRQSFFAPSHVLHGSDCQITNTHIRIRTHIHTHTHLMSSTIIFLIWLLLEMYSRFSATSAIFSATSPVSNPTGKKNKPISCRSY